MKVGMPHFPPCMYFSPNWAGWGKERGKLWGKRRVPPCWWLQHGGNVQGGNGDCTPPYWLGWVMRAARRGGFMAPRDGWYLSTRTSHLLSGLPERKAAAIFTLYLSLLSSARKNMLQEGVAVFCLVHMPFPLSVMRSSHFHVQTHRTDTAMSSLAQIFASYRMLMITFELLLLYYSCYKGNGMRLHWINCAFLVGLLRELLHPMRCADFQLN